MYYHNQGHGLQDNHGQTVECVTTNPPSASFLSFEAQGYNTQEAPWGMDVIQTQHFEPTSELQGMSFPSKRRVLTFLKGPAHSQAAFDPYAWQEPPEGLYETTLSVPLALPPADDLLAAWLNAPIPVDPPANVNTFNDVNVQTSHAQMLYSGEVDHTYGCRNASDELIPGNILVGDVPNAISTSSRSSGIAGGLLNCFDPIMNVDPHGDWDRLFHHDNTGVSRGSTNIGDGPASDVMDINILSLRLRGARLPPQTYERDVLKLYHRLEHEGANPCAAMIVRDVIFAAEVTVDALMAPIPTREMSIKYGGARRMWQMLLETKEVVPGKKKYFCLLCPVEGCSGYSYDRDAVRHFNREHFGFSFPCEYW